MKLNEKEIRREREEENELMRKEEKEKMEQMIQTRCESYEKIVKELESKLNEAESRGDTLNDSQMKMENELKVFHLLLLLFFFSRKKTKIFKFK